MDKIIIRGLRLFGYHGVNPEEREQGQYFVLDVEAAADLSQAGQTDVLEDTVNYARMIRCIRRVFTEQTNDLIERVAQRVCDALLAEFPGIQSVRLRLQKPEAPVEAAFSYVAVEIERSRL